MSLGSWLKSRRLNTQTVIQEAQLLQRGCATLRVAENYAKSLLVTQHVDIYMSFFLPVSIVRGL